MNKGRQYILISSATVYQQTDEEITEESALGNSFWSYGVNKIACERYLSENHEKFGFEYTIIRPYVTYGNTRIPYALVNGEYWSLANRILGGKPILLWDGGQAICTLTHTEDFAVGLVGLFGNQMAYGQAFHITSDERLTWKKALVLTGKALQKKPEIFSASSKDISDVLPEYKGVLFGDKANNKIFNNSKIKNAVPDFSQTIPFGVGIKQTIEYFLSNRKERRVSYYWDGKMDRVILMLAKKEGRQIDKSILKFYSYDQDNSLENKLRYYLGRCKLFCIVYDRMKTMKR